MKHPPQPFRPGGGLEPLEPRLLWSASAPPAAFTADLVTALDTYWQFEDTGSSTISDRSGSAAAHTGALTGSAGVSSFGAFGGSGYFSGGEASITNHADFNLSTLGQRTIAMWFFAEDVDAPGRQMLYEEGAGTRGLNIYIEDGRLYVGGWNRAESNWSGTWLSTDAVQSGHWHHVALVLDGGAVVTEDAFRGYLDGVQFGSGEGSQLWGHSGDINVGNGGDTRYPDGSGSATDPFIGYIDEFRAYTRVLTDHDLAVLGGAFNERAAIANTLPPRDIVTVFLGDAAAFKTQDLLGSNTADMQNVKSVGEVDAPSLMTRGVTPQSYATPGTDGPAPAESEPQEEATSAERSAGDADPRVERSADAVESAPGERGDGPAEAESADPSRIAEVETERKAGGPAQDKRVRPAKQPDSAPARMAPEPDRPRIDALRLGTAPIGFALPLSAANRQR